MKRLRKYSYPYLFWMTVFILFPTLILIVLAFSTLELYDPHAFTFSLLTFAVFRQAEIIPALFHSLEYAGITTVVCFLIGYPVAYYLTTLPEHIRKILMALLIVPLWSNVLLRIVAWEKVFTPDGIFADLFGFSFDLLGTETGVIIGLVAMYLPFMIFPIFSVLEKMDYGLVEASHDLGAGDVATFLRVTFPLSLGGVVSGVIMTMLPAMTAFVLPKRIGLGNISLIGNVIERKFMLEVFSSSGQSINQGSLISLFLMAFSVISFILITRVDKEGETLI